MTVDKKWRRISNQYNDFVAEIKTSKALLLVKRKKLQDLIYSGAPKDVQAMQYDRVLVNGSSPKQSDYEQYDSILSLKNEIMSLEKQIHLLELERTKLEEWFRDTAKKHEGNLQLKLFYLRAIKGLRLVDIAEQLYLSYGYVRVVWSQMTNIDSEKEKEVL